ncbi:MAG: hypothetical protein M1834_000616 [Cirrosporium novae-zelandiae]|nr:MAG: hypothetical protein M1834_000616 [Cirrosporium novae-zelandiae]
MSLFRLPRPPVLRAIQPALTSRRLYGSQDYGSGEGDPRGSDPKAQGPNPSEHLEHPGPPAPSIPSTNEQSSPNKGGTGNRSKSTNAQPKILNEQEPVEESEDVRKHNEEVERRSSGKAQNVEPGLREKVGKGFWSGHGGADRNP